MACERGLAPSSPVYPSIRPIETIEGSNITVAGIVYNTVLGDTPMRIDTLFCQWLVAYACAASGSSPLQH